MKKELRAFSIFNGLAGARRDLRGRAETIRNGYLFSAARSHPHELNGGVNGTTHGGGQAMMGPSAIPRTSMALSRARWFHHNEHFKRVPRVEGMNHLKRWMAHRRSS